MKLNQIRDNAAATKKRTRICRGIGSGEGKTGGRGVKGQKSRTGVAIKGFEGGQTPIYRRLPKRGFTNIFRKQYVEVGLDRVQSAIDAGRLDASGVVDADALTAAAVVRRAKDGVRLLANGALTTPVSFKVAGASKAAITAVERVGGKIVCPAVVKTTNQG